MGDKTPRKILRTGNEKPHHDKDDVVDEETASTERLAGKRDAGDLVPDIAELGLTLPLLHLKDKKRFRDISH